MQASYTPNILVSTHIFRPINFVHLTYQIDVILHSPPTPTQGGSSLIILVMTTSQTNERSFQVSIWTGLEQSMKPMIGKSIDQSMTIDAN